MTLVREAGAEAEFGERNVRIEQAFAGSADAQAMNMLADPFANAAAKHARKMHGMDAGFTGESVEHNAAAMVGLQLVEDAMKPRRGVAAVALGGTRGKGENFGEKAFDGEVIASGRSFDFAKELHGQPKQRAAADVVARSVHSGRAVGEAFLPLRAKLDFVKADAARADFVLMRNAGGTEHQSKWSVLPFTAAAALAVMSVKHHGEKGKLMRVLRELARRRVTHVGENGAALLARTVDGAEELARAHVLGRRRGCPGNICVGCSVRHKGTSGRRLHLF